MCFFSQDLEKAFSSSEKAKKIVSLEAFYKFDNTAEALAETAAMVDSKIGKDLKKFLKSTLVVRRLPWSMPSLAVSSRRN